MTPDLFGGIAALLYLAYLWLQLRSKAFETFSNRRVAAFALPALLSHLIYAVFLIQTEAGIQLTAWSSAVLVLWVATALTFYLYLVQGYRVLAFIVVPLSFIAIGGSLALPMTHNPPIEQTTAIVHVLVSMLAYATLALAALQAGAIIALHYRLKKHDATAFIKLMPPLQTVESTSSWLLWLGGALLTISIATGFIGRWDFVQEGNYLTHLTLAFAAWFIYVALIAGQLWFGWRGLLSARLSLLAFAVLVLGYFGLTFIFGYGT
ncbi:MAG: hypothetical protein F4W90_01630 [Gammaproteobacteria bacterium]|nr:hypothetical protein [Gammaproteobacteria bacterium]